MNERKASGRSKTGRFFRVMLLYIILGPPLGSVVYVIGLLVEKGAPNGIVHFIQSYFVIFVLTPIGLIFTYLIGLIPAALAGLIIAAIDVATRLNFARTLLLVAAAGLPSSVLFLVIGAATPAENPLIWINWPNTLVKILTCMVPTIVVWLILQRWRRVSIPVPRRIRIPQ